MSLENISFFPIGTVVEKNTVEVYPEYISALKGITDFSHIYILYFFHKRHKDLSKLLQVRLKDSSETVGVFAQRSVIRPNPIGLSLVKLLNIENRRLKVKGLDAIKGTPILDIKPYIHFNFNPIMPQWAQRKQD